MADTRQSVERPGQCADIAVHMAPLRQQAILIKVEASDHPRSICRGADSHGVLNHGLSPLAVLASAEQDRNHPTQWPSLSTAFTQQPARAPVEYAPTLELAGLVLGRKTSRRLPRA